MNKVEVITVTFSFKCSLCGAEYELDPALYCCPLCQKDQKSDEPLKGVLEVKLNGSVSLEEFSIEAFLPVDKKFFPPMPVGDTPLWNPKRIKDALGFSNLYIKDDSSNPTGSFKDRASFLVSAYAAQNSIDTIVLASTGNAGSSMSGMGASTGQNIVLFLPETAPPAKMIQAVQYGAKVYKVKGNYDMAYDLSMEYSQKYGGMNRNTAWNPMTMEGKKTVSLEIFRDLGYKAPDRVYVSTGDGCIIGGVFKGFKDLLEMGLIKKMPKIIAVQAEGSSALYRALQTGKFTNEGSATVADSISVDIPRNGYTALKYIKDYNGDALCVTDKQIIEAQAHLSSHSGLFTEPAGAAAWAGFLKEKDQLDKNETIVVLTTGSGLKDPASALKGITMPEKSISGIDEI